MIDGLEPCPHCGEAEELYRSYHGLGCGEPYAIDCLGCGCDFTPREGMDVIAAWNARAPDPALAAKDATIAELEAENTQMRDALEYLSYIHDSNPSDAMADMPELDYARHMLFEARKLARAALEASRTPEDKEQANV